MRSASGSRSYRVVRSIEAIRIRYRILNSVSIDDATFCWAFNEMHPKKNTAMIGRARG